MDWKEFLKPTIKKIVISAIILFFLFIFLFTKATNENLFNLWMLVAPIAFLFAIFSSPILTFSPLINDLVFALILSFYWYLLSCLIIWTYKGVKEKNKRNIGIGILVFIIILIYSFIPTPFTIPPPSIESSKLETLKNNACEEYLRLKCREAQLVLVPYPSDPLGSISLRTFARMYYDCADDICINRLCGCS